MGCVNSKQKRCRHCQAPYSPVHRSHSLHGLRPRLRNHDSHHVVALTSTTLGSLLFDSPNNCCNNSNNVNASVDINNNNDDNDHHQKIRGYYIEDHGSVGVENGKDMNNKKSFSMGLIESKTWSDTIQDKISEVLPRTPVRTPPGEPEVINIWELMEGLEDDSSPVNLPHHFRSFSFDVLHESSAVPDSPQLSSQQEKPNGMLLGGDLNKPMWSQMEDGDANLECPEFDPEVIETFRQSLQEVSPSHPFYIKAPSDCEKQHPQWTKIDDSNKLAYNSIAKDNKRGKDKVVVYFTSLRGVRKTYEDCCHVRVILKGLGVRVDEKDVSMHSGFKEELRELLGEGFKGGGLPRVFVGRKYIGGAEEIRQMHEEGELEKEVEGCEMSRDDGGGGGGTACEACGDIRFVPCETCSGSCKIYYEGDEEELQVDFGFQRCPDCNENGLIRCPICCDV